MSALRVVALSTLLGVVTGAGVGCTDRVDTPDPNSNATPATEPEPSDEAVLAAEPIVDETVELDPEDPDYRSDEGL